MFRNVVALYVLFFLGMGLTSCGEISESEKHNDSPTASTQNDSEAEQPEPDIVAQPNPIVDPIDPVAVPVIGDINLPSQPIIPIFPGGFWGGGGGGSNNRQDRGCTNCAPELLYISIILEQSATGAAEAEVEAAAAAEATIYVGGTVQFLAIGHYSDGSVEDLTDQIVWSSSNSAVATVSSTGLVTGVSPGVVTITATFGELSGSLTLQVFKFCCNQRLLSLPKWVRSIRKAM